MILSTHGIFNHKKIIIAIIISLLIILLLLIIFNSNTIENKNIKILAEKEENIETITYEIYANNVNENMQILVQVNSEKGIKLINCPNGNKINANNKNKVAIDYEVEKDKEYNFDIELNDGSMQTRKIQIGDKELQKVINIGVTSEKELGTEANLKIDFNTADILTNKQYKIGFNGKYTNYTTDFILNSYNILKNNLGINEDKTITIYVKAITNEGIGIELEKKISCLDFDMPIEPVATVSVLDSYATLTSEGVKLNSEISIQYDTRDDIQNYYSLDNGENWIEVQGNKLETTNLYSLCKIQMKSVKKES